MSPSVSGAIVTGQTFSEAVKHGLDPHDYLTRNDSYTFFRACYHRANGNKCDGCATDTSISYIILFDTFLLTKKERNYNQHIELEKSVADMSCLQIENFVKNMLLSIQY